jgi:hypothetical protein
MDEIIELTTAGNQQEAEIIKSLLESAGIDCVLKSDLVEPLYNFQIGPLAEVRIYVHKNDVDKAWDILDAYSQNPADGE